MDDGKRGETTGPSDEQCECTVPDGGQTSWRRPGVPEYGARLEKISSRDWKMVPAI